MMVITGCRLLVTTTSVAAVTTTVAAKVVGGDDKSRNDNNSNEPRARCRKLGELVNQIITRDVINVMVASKLKSLIIDPVRE